MVANHPVFALAGTCKTVVQRLVEHRGATPKSHGRPAWEHRSGHRSAASVRNLLTPTRWVAQEQSAFDFGCQQPCRRLARATTKATPTPETKRPIAEVEITWEVASPSRQAIIVDARETRPPEIRSTTSGPGRARPGSSSSRRVRYAEARSRIVDHAPSNPNRPASARAR